MLDKEMLNECDWEEDSPHITGYCSSCGKPATSVTVDYGIGGYEFWGARGTHHDYAEESKCCEAEVIECQLPCHAKCRFFTDEYNSTDVYVRCEKGITEEAVDGKTCDSFEPVD